MPNEAEGTESNVVDMPQRGLGGVAELLKAANAQGKEQEPGEGGGGNAGQGTGGAAHNEPNRESEQQIIDSELADPLETKPPGGKTEKPGSLAQLAESAGITLDELYKLNVSMADGRGEMPLSQLKDNVTEGSRIEEQREQLETNRSEFENEMIRARQELSVMVGLLPELPPEFIAKAKQQHIEHLDTERAALLDIKPEWADPAKFQAAQDHILTGISEYGFSRADLNMISDHRLTKLLHDFATLKERVGKANARLKEVRDNAAKRPARKKADATKAQKNATLAQAQTSSQTRDKVAGVAQILKDAQK